MDALNLTGCAFHLGGSFASSIHGEARFTRDADLVADLRIDQTERLVALLERDFYVDADMIRDAIQRHASFNVIHLDSGFKVDVFILGTGPYDREEFSRHRPERILREPPRDVFCATPEDTVLRKLLWYRQGGEVMEQQVRDVIGVLEVQGDRVDLVYMRHWADEIGVRDLLEDALRFVGPA